MADAELNVETVSVRELHEHPKNPRQGDVSGLAESMVEHGQYQPLVVQRSTGYVLVGNHRLKAARRLGWTQIQAIYLDVDDERATRIMLVDNKSSDSSSYDSKLLLEVLNDLPDLAGTGYDSTDLDLLAFDANDQEPVELPRQVESNGGVEPPNEQIVWGYLQFGSRRVTLTAVEVERLNALHDLYLDEEGTDAGWGHKIGEGLDAVFGVDSEALAYERLGDAERVLRAGKRGRAKVDAGTQFTGTEGAPGVDELAAEQARLAAEANERLAAAGVDPEELPSGEVEEEDE